MSPGADSGKGRRENRQSCAYLGPCHVALGSRSRQFVEQTVLGWRSVEGSSLSSVIVGEVGQLGLRKGIRGSAASNLAAYGEGNYAIMHYSGKFPSRGKKWFSPKSPRSPATPVRLVKAFKVAVFKLHNPSQRKRAVMRDAMKRAHLAYTKLLDAHLPDQDEIDRLAALPTRERPSTWIISHGFHSGHVWLVPAARTKRRR